VVSSFNTDTTGLSHFEKVTITIAVELVVASTNIHVGQFEIVLDTYKDILRCRTCHGNATD